MGHWKRLIKIPSATDCYYCIKNMTCLIYVSYCVDILVLFRLFIRYHVTCISCYIFDIRYIPCGSMQFMYMYTMHCIWSVSCIPCRHHDCICTIPYDDSIVYAHLHVHIAYAHLHVHFGHVTTSTFISITSPLDDIIYDITWIRLET